MVGFEFTTAGEEPPRRSPSPRRVAGGDELEASAPLFEAAAPAPPPPRRSRRGISALGIEMLSLRRRVESVPFILDPTASGVARARGRSEAETLLRIWSGRILVCTRKNLESAPHVIESKIIFSLRNRIQIPI